MVLANKILCLGIDGMDPRFTRKLVDEGKLPNIEKMIERGAARRDLAMVGAMPTVTPPMWTTLATGAYPNTHRITCYFRASENALDKVVYNFDSRRCKAEPLWNVFAEAGKKTLVWHWPGSSWPPTSDNVNLYVVDGSSPGSVAMSVGQVENEFMFVADEKASATKFMEKAVVAGVQPCIISGMEEKNLEVEFKGVTTEAAAGDAEMSVYILERDEGQGGSPNQPLDFCSSSIKPASGWKIAVPKEAKEFSLLLGRGLINRPCLILKGKNDVYDHVAIYKNKQTNEPIAVLHDNEFKSEILDEGLKGGEISVLCNRNMKMLEIAQDGSQVRMWVSAAMNTTMDTVWHPKELFKTVTENVGFPTPTTMIGSQDEEQITRIMLENWYSTLEWQAKSLNYLIEHENFEVIFSHFHNIDIQGHMIVRFMTDKGFNKLPPEKFQQMMEAVYVQTDRYVGKFLHLLDRGWTIALMSDHGQVCPTYDIPLIGDIIGINIRVMQELGLTALKKDDDGNELKEMDWEHTYAVAQRGNHIYLNIKGRDKYGIIEPSEQYEWEEEIMTRLYGYKDKKTGKRIIALALRNKDAVLLGMGGPDCGDIIYFTAEGYNYDHGESLGTCWGEANTSVSPIFVMAGRGIKEGFETERVIRQVDFCPTIALLGGVRMPKQCEGAPVYQIIAEV